ncbi:hypothetical protein LQZ24_00740 [Fructobacillus sp. M1-13]|uniref:Uncharacterized protein n=1 Tax=Fructobacillus papyriferae TaxID=2713171 RepID=A0ABS5QQ04_9LACO|nr:hypothetical protein [Fructobacillus papyriferae]MBS9334565.1 hypothetical protein [Fructobacillus papyriferae]MCD2158554.1 hypothetical protein [Fructobacillus papyriferae]
MELDDYRNEFNRQQAKLDDQRDELLKMTKKADDIIWDATSQVQWITRESDVDYDEFQEVMRKIRLIEDDFVEAVEQERQALRRASERLEDEYERQIRYLKD